jgi:two-component system cell cycle response regulator
MLTKLSKDAQLPAVFTELRPGQVSLFKEDSPKKAYGMLKETESYGIESLCITKLSPETIREKYGIRKTSILWVTFEKAETTITPKDIAGLIKNVSEFSMKPDGTIILIDCFDQLKFANGFERFVDILKILRALSLENNSILFISIPPMMFEKEELFTIEKELKEGMQQ